jgi:cell division control protein 6
MASNIFRALSAERGVFRDEAVLRPEFLPDELPGREREMRELASYLHPVIRGQAPQSVLLMGPPGVGKTSLSKLVLKQLTDVSRKALPLYINCWETSTRFGILNELVLALGDMMPRRGIAADELSTRLREIGKREGTPIPILVLDEVDRLFAASTHEDQVLYDLTRSSETFGLPCSVIGITNDTEISLKLDARVRSTLTNHLIEFKPYSPDQLKAILSERSKRAFLSEVLEAEVVSVCAAAGAKGGGDARISLHLLWSAGRKAESEGAAKVTLAHVKAVQAASLSSASTPAERKSADLDEMDQRIVEGLRQAGGAGLVSGDVYALFKADASEQRTLRNRLSRLERGGLLTGEDVDVAGGHTRKWKLRKTA